ncbi:MAG TPA: HAMP domain-containing sensor histidine kinase [Ktedonosporobacter sp.]|nr:HAMP domain-containing sensor histidine kinase [Ktedonosporobacter sp.]
MTVLPVKRRLTLWLSLIRTRLTLWLMVILAVGMLAFVLTTLLAAQTILRNLNEERLRQSVTSLSDALAQEPEANVSLVRNQLDAFSTPDIYLQYQSPQGTPIASSKNMGRLILPLSQIQSAIATDRVAAITFENSPFLLYGRSVLVRGQVRGYVIAARLTSDSEEQILLFRLMYTGVFVTLILTALLVWLLVRQMLRPLERLADSASRITIASDHALRLQAGERPDEINRLAQTINGTLNSLEDAYQQVQNVNELQRRFLADVSHELRTPLTIMLSSLELMKKEQGSDPEFQANALENIQIEAERMARLVTRLLMLARTDASAPFAREPLLIADVIREAYHQDCPANRNIRMECHGLEALEDAVVSGNADYLKQVLLIILENACKYTPDGGKVTILGEMRADHLAITIADTGIGIDQTEVPRIFERFYRAPNARDLPGMGLGLSIARGIIEQHNGTISVESTPGRGSRFIIALPLLNAEHATFTHTLG